MAMGAKAADPAVRVLPAFLPFADLVQVLDPSVSNVTMYLDGLNAHVCVRTRV
jgi:hypothetical protein